MAGAHDGPRRGVGFAQARCNGRAAASTKEKRQGSALDGKNDGRRLRRGLRRRRLPESASC